MKMTEALPEEPAKLPEVTEKEGVTQVLIDTTTEEGKRGLRQAALQDRSKSRDSEGNSRVSGRLAFSSIILATLRLRNSRTVEGLPLGLTPIT
jgi:hypothetical protein